MKGSDTNYCIMCRMSPSFPAVLELPSAENSGSLDSIPEEHSIIINGDDSSAAVITGRLSIANESSSSSQVLLGYNNQDRNNPNYSSRLLGKVVVGFKSLQRFFTTHAKLYSQHY